MTTSTAEFFDNLSRRGHEPMLERVDATVRFDVTDGDRTEHRLVRIGRGDIRVSAEDEPADCVMTGERAVFDLFTVRARNDVHATVLHGGIIQRGPDTDDIAWRNRPIR